MSILVTGGAGYIGSHVVKELRRLDKEIVIVDNLSTGHIEAVQGLNLFVGDIADALFLKDIMVKHKVDSVIHFAASSLVGESQDNPAKYYGNNVAGTLSLLQAMRECGVMSIVFSSSAAVYGEPKEIPIKEDALTCPVNVYGRTKLMIEQILEDYRRAYGINFISLRYFNACGADEEGLIGEDHTPETHLIPIVMQVVNGQRNSLIIYGDDYPTPDGTCIRDYIHVNDLASAHILALEYLEKERKSGIYNLGYGHGYSVKEIVQAVEKITGQKIKVEIGERRLGDPAILVADSTRMQRELGWKPLCNDLAYIIRTAWEWHRLRPDGYKTSTE
jgi:UDP-glucose 4-epimerase